MSKKTLIGVAFVIVAATCPQFRVGASELVNYATASLPTNTT